MIATVTNTRKKKMILHILMGQRKESYPGEYAPEALAVMTEYGQDENPEYMAEEKKKYRDSGEFESIAVIDFDTSDKAIMAVLRPSSKAIAAVVVGSDAAAT